MIELDIYKKLRSAEGDMELSVNIRIESGSFTALNGPSGAGKTSLLRILSGLLEADKGYIYVDRECWLDSNNNKSLPARKRSIGYVLQEYSLFPNMTVRENLRFALHKKDDPRCIEELIEIAELGDLQKLKPYQLSGGQQQRVALARALVRRPKLLLLDEPLSALDSEMRQKLQGYIVSLHRKYELTSILVSHDISEIIRMSDRLIIIDNGKIIKDGAPEHILTSQKISGKFQLTGELVGLEKQDIIYVLTLLIGSELVKVVADPNELGDLKIGDKVMASSKAFNPIISKLAIK